MSKPATTTVCVPEVSDELLLVHGTATGVPASIFKVQLEAFTPELTPPAVGSATLQLNVNGTDTLPDAGEILTDGCVSSTRMLFEVAVPAPVMAWLLIASVPLAPVPLAVNVSVPSPETEEQVYA
jgi:hypothetical protein